MSTSDIANPNNLSTSMPENVAQAVLESVETANATEPWLDTTALPTHAMTDTGERETVLASIPLPIRADTTELEQALQQMMTAIEGLHSAFDSKIRYDTSKQQTIDALHEELQLHREGLHFRLLRPIFLDLIDMYNDLDKLLKREDAVTPSSENEVRLWRNLESFQATIEEVLYRNGVEAYTEASDRFVAQRQRALKTLTTENADLDGAIAERVRKGFAYEGRVLRPETVVIYKFVQRSRGA